MGAEMSAVGAEAPSIPIGADEGTVHVDQRRTGSATREPGAFPCLAVMDVLKSWHHFAHLKSTKRKMRKLHALAGNITLAISVRVASRRFASLPKEDQCQPGGWSVVEVETKETWACNGNIES